MADSVDQIEKHTLVLRLSVSIYQMSLEQLGKLLRLFDQTSDSRDGQLQGIGLNGNKGRPDEAIQRQIIIARLFVIINQLDKETLLEYLQQFKHPDFSWVRAFPRMNCYLLVDFAAQGKAYNGYIKDISANGVFIETSDRFDNAQEVALCFTLAESGENLPLKINGRVSRIYPDGIGVRYTQITEYQRDIIQALIQKAS